MPADTIGGSLFDQPYGHKRQNVLQCRILCRAPEVAPQQCANVNVSNFGHARTLVEGCQNKMSTSAPIRHVRTTSLKRFAQIVKHNTTDRVPRVVRPVHNNSHWPNDGSRPMAAVGIFGMSGQRAKEAWALLFVGPSRLYIFYRNFLLL